MYTIIIIVVLFVTIGAYKGLKENNFRYNYWYNWFDYIAYGFLNLAIGFFVGLIISLALPCKTYLETKELKLESTALNKDINGNFFIFGGYVKNNYNYAVYVKENNAFKLQLLPYDQTVIKYTDNNPVLKITREKITNDFINNFSCVLELKVNYELQVPEGSIVKEYKLQ